MIIAHSRRFIFIKTRKTAGTSIEVFLSGNCAPDDVFTPLRPSEDGHEPRNCEGFYNHMPASEVVDSLGSAAWGSYFSFCVERNPWDKVVSHFHMMKARSKGGLEFSQYLEEGEFPVDFEKYTRQGGIIVDRVLRYEALEDELSEIFQRLSIPYGGKLGVRAKSGYRPQKDPYQGYFTSSQADIVANAFRREIDLFGFSFD